MSGLTQGDDLSRLYLDAASIPHFLHWDLAYLWMLVRHEKCVPPVWRDRIRLWRNLLRAFLAGRLTIKQHEVEPQILHYLEVFRIRKLSLLEFQGRVVGLLSPLVVVRPLPDGKPLLPDISEQEYPRIAQALSLTMEALQSLGDKKSAAGDAEAANALRRLHSILDRELESLGQPGLGAHLTEVPHELLVHIPYFGQDESAVETVSIKLYQCQDADSRRWFVPRCSGCGDLLTSDHRRGSIPVSEDFVRLTCSKCSLNNDVPLRDLFIWLRKSGERGSEVIVWIDRGGFHDLPSNAIFPPDARVDAQTNKVFFEWNPGATNDSARRFLALQFDLPVRCASVLDDALYRKFLDLGERSQEVRGLPLRWAWRDALKSPESVQSDRLGLSVRFRNIWMQGLPFSFSRIYGQTCIQEPDAGVAMFPGPSIHSKWQRHRIFLVEPPSDSHSKLLLRADGVALTPNAVECNGWPQRFAVEAEDDRTGVSFFLPPLQDAVPTQAGLHIGLDFGTTNTVLYFAELGETVSTEKNALRPAGLREAFHWVARPEHIPERLWWMPEEVKAAFGQDPCLLPSSVWTWDRQAGELVRVAIRWHDARPCEEAREETGFKWDEGLQDRTSIRIGFLSELFFWSIPLMLGQKRLDPRLLVPLHVCATFPLSFSYEHRGKMEQALQKVQTSILQHLGYEVTFFRLDESRAAVRVLGKYNPGELTLVADLGGRTLDVVLFRTSNLDKPLEIMQVGSIDLGGELFVEKLAHGNARQAWQYRDQIRSGRASALGKAPGARNILDRIQILAFEVIRTMIAAYRQEHPDSFIRLLLIGNGWRLRDLFAGGENPVSHLTGWAERRANNTGLVENPEKPKLKVTAPIVQSISSSKHFVAVGALMHLAGGSGKTSQLGQHEPSDEQTKLPAGRRIDVEDRPYIEWFEPIGDGGRYFERMKAVEKGLGIAAADCPKLTDSWKAEIQDFLDNLPSEANLRDWLLTSIENEKLLKGPLQLLIERHWKGLI